MGRRGSGEGSVHRYKDKWRVRVRRHGRERSWICGSHKEASAKLREIMEAADPTRLKRQRLTVASWAERWLAEVALNRPKTLRSYATNLARILPTLGPIPLEELQLEEINRCLADVLRGGVSRTTVQHTHSTLATMLRAAVRSRVLLHSPMQDSPRPTRAHFEAVTLRPAQIRRLVDEANREAEGEDQIGSLVLAALASGMRKGELLALRWADIDLEHGEIVVNKAHRRVMGGGIVVDSPKTRSGRRVLPLDPRMVPILTRHRARQDAARLAAGGAWADSGLVFCGPHGEARESSSRTLNVHWHRLHSRAGIAHMRFHDLRHTAGLALSRRVGLVAASRVLGHANPTITARFYGHAQPEDLEAGVRGVADAMFGSASLEQDQRAKDPEPRADPLNGSEAV